MSLKRSEFIAPSSEVDEPIRALGDLRQLSASFAGMRPNDGTSPPHVQALNAFRSMRAAIGTLQVSRWLSSRAAALPTYASAEAIVETFLPTEPVFCLYPDDLRRAAACFAAFPGRTAYAVKCNPHPTVLRTLFEAGIRDFDVASIGEVSLIDSLFGKQARMFFNNPIKGRSAISRAHGTYGVQGYTIDHESELDKILDEAGNAEDLVLAVRLATRATDARYALTTKYGANLDEAVRLLKRVHASGARPALTFHVGSQCLAPESFTAALSLCGDVICASGAHLSMLNVGGGFPAPYPGDAAAPLSAYFAAINDGLRQLALPDDCQLICEPGRALVATAGSVIAQVLVRKADTIYINDGVFGSLQELRHPKERRPAQLIGRVASDQAGTCAFKVYGPTCDSDDVLGAPLTLPGDIAEGDWIEISMMGAYSLVTKTNFNGFFTDNVATIKP